MVDRVREREPQERVKMKGFRYGVESLVVGVRRRRREVCWFFFFNGFRVLLFVDFFFFFCFQVWRREMEGEGGGCHFFVECFSLVLLLSVARKKNEKGER